MNWGEDVQQPGICQKVSRKFIWLIGTGLLFNNLSSNFCQRCVLQAFHNGDMYNITKDVVVSKIHTYLYLTSRCKDVEGIDGAR